MLKALVFVVGFVLAFVNASVAFRYAKRKSCFFTPFNFAIVAFALTLFSCIVIVVLFDRLGWYPD